MTCGFPCNVASAGARFLSGHLRATHSVSRIGPSLSYDVSFLVPHTLTILPQPVSTRSHMRPQTVNKEYHRDTHVPGRDERNLDKRQFLSSQRRSVRVILRNVLLPVALRGEKDRSQYFYGRDSAGTVIDITNK